MSNQDIEREWERKWSARARRNLPHGGDDASLSDDEDEDTLKLVVEVPSRRSSPRIYTPSPRSQSMLLNLAKEKASMKIDTYRKETSQLQKGGAENLLLSPSETIVSAAHLIPHRTNR